MTAGLNLRATIWTFNYTDDAIGGSLPTGTPAYQNVQLRISPQKSTLALLEQGLETPTIFMGVLSPPYNPTGTFTLQNNQQIEITDPPISEHYQKKFVILNVQPATMNDPRKYWFMTLRRFEVAHSNDLM